MVSQAAAESNRIRASFPANKSSITKRALICSAGINDADYVVNPSVSGVRFPCDAYSTWRDMIQRCHDKDYKMKHKHYANATCSKEWESFMSFREWWINNHVDGFDIDKDILSLGMSHYSKETCIYIPRWLNTFCAIGGRSESEFIGVFYEEKRGKYKASMTHLGATINIGRYNTKEEASLAWLRVKTEIAASKKDEIEAISSGLYDKVVQLLSSRAAIKK